MVRLEELPDDFDESTKLDQTPAPGTAEEDGSLDDLFDRAAARGGLTNKTFEEALSDMSKTPLFMSSLEDAGDEDNLALQALQALQYEGPKSEAAQNFKEQGNECVQAKKWSDAKEFYTKGIAVIQSKDEAKWDKPEDQVAEDKLRQTLLEQLYGNRARCNLELKNYRSTTLDCSAVLKINPTNIKAHYRSASALFALDKIYEALDVSYRGLQLDPSNIAMKTLLEKIQKRSRIKEEQDRKRRNELATKRKERLTLFAALKARNIRIKSSSKKGPPDMADAEIRLVPDPLSPKSTLEFPTMLLYPMHNQSDFIKAFAEKDAIAQHLSYILPLPWDEKGEYKSGTVECYMDTVSGGLMKLGKKMSLLEILAHEKVEVLDGLVRIFVVPKELSGKWLEEIRRKRGK